MSEPGQAAIAEVFDKHNGKATAIAFDPLVREVFNFTQMEMQRFLTATKKTVKDADAHLMKADRHAKSGGSIWLLATAEAFMGPRGKRKIRTNRSSPDVDGVWVSMCAWSRLAVSNPCPRCRCTQTEVYPVLWQRLSTRDAAVGDGKGGGQKRKAGLAALVGAGASEASDGSDEKKQKV